LGRISTLSIEATALWLPLSEWSHLMRDVVNLNIIELLNSFLSLLCLIKLNNCLASGLPLSVLEDADVHDFP